MQQNIMGKKALVIKEWSDGTYRIGEEILRENYHPLFKELASGKTPKEARENYERKQSTGTD